MISQHLKAYHTFLQLLYRLIANVWHHCYSRSSQYHIRTIPHFPNIVSSLHAYVLYPINTLLYKIRSQKGGQNPKIKVKNHPFFSLILVKVLRLFSCLFNTSLLHSYLRCCHNGRQLVPPLQRELSLCIR